MRGDSVCLSYLSLQRPVVGDPLCDAHVRGDAFSLVFCGHHRFHGRFSISCQSANTTNAHQHSMQTVEIEVFLFSVVEWMHHVPGEFNRILDVL